MASPVAVKSGQDGRRAWEQGCPQPQASHEAGVPTTPEPSSQNSEAPASARNRGAQDHQILSSVNPGTRRLHSPGSPASILMVYFHVCLPHSTVSDFRFSNFM